MPMFLLMALVTLGIFFTTSSGTNCLLCTFILGNKSWLVAPVVFVCLEGVSDFSCVILLLEKEQHYLNWWMCRKQTSKLADLHVKSSTFFLSVLRKTMKNCDLCYMWTERDCEKAVKLRTQYTKIISATVAVWSAKMLHAMSSETLLPLGTDENQFFLSRMSWPQMLF